MITAQKLRVLTALFTALYAMYVRLSSFPSGYLGRWLHICRDGERRDPPAGQRLYPPQNALCNAFLVHSIDVYNFVGG